ncbi:hypothetical protein L1887_26392 [Cichorium endivia]|nr:hypothetical protein L1887_26392 [Cichorium endivia]
MRTISSFASSKARRERERIYFHHRSRIPRKISTFRSKNCVLKRLNRGEGAIRKHSGVIYLLYFHRIWPANINL